MEANSAEPEQVERQPYHPPRLSVHGTVRDVTLSAGNKNNLDGGATGGMTKTTA